MKCIPKVQVVRINFLSINPFNGDWMHLTFGIFTTVQTEGWNIYGPLFIGYRIIQTHICTHIFISCTYNLCGIVFRYNPSFVRNMRLVGISYQCVCSVISYGYETVPKKSYPNWVWKQTVFMSMHIEICASLSIILFNGRVWLAWCRYMTEFVELDVIYLLYMLWFTFLQGSIINFLLKACLDIIILLCVIQHAT